MTHEDLNRLGPELEERCNAAIQERFPSWSRYAVDQMVESTMCEIAPGWSWLVMRTVNRVPEIVLKQYLGPIEP